MLKFLDTIIFERKTVISVIQKVICVPICCQLSTLSSVIILFTPFTSCPSPPLM